MTAEINEKLVRDKQQALAVLCKQYQASIAQQNATLSEADKITLDIESKQIWAKIEERQVEISALQAAQQMSAKRYRQISCHWGWVTS